MLKQMDFLRQWLDSFFSFFWLTHILIVNQMLKLCTYYPNSHLEFIPLVTFLP